VSKTWFDVTVYAVLAPPVVIDPLVSSRNLATAAIVERAESLMDEGAWPSAQLIVESAVALLEAVLLQVYSVIVVLLLVYMNLSINSPQPSIPS